MDAPDAVTVDKKGELFVSNDEYSSIVEFKRDSTTPTGNSITQDLANPEGTAYSPPLLP
jgi:hypothetical protein